MQASQGSTLDSIRFSNLPLDFRVAYSHSFSVNYACAHLHLLWQELALNPETSVRDSSNCAHMVPRSIPTRSRFRLGTFFDLVIGSASVPRLEVNVVRVITSMYPLSVTPLLRQLLRQMGSGLVDTK